MGANRKRRVKALEPNSEIGQIETDGHSSPSEKFEALSSRLESKTTSFVNKCTSSSVLDLNTGESLHLPAKIKLQLFPIDESTRLGLEKDGFNPYLELTLSAKKKISSVIKHLDSKWGSSSIAVGDPMLFPSSVADNVAGYKWTRNDIGISARDVHLTMGSPSVFRLRYGWMCDPATKTQTQPSAPATFGASSKFEDVQNDCKAPLQKTYGNGEKTEVRGEESEKPIMATEETNAVVAEKMPSNEAVYSMDNEVKMDGCIGQSLALWADSLSNISIGGLLSEASLQGFCNFDPKSNGSNAGLQSSQLISDSFDAFLSGQINRSQNPSPPPQNPQLSILDAEDTCHAFSFQKFASSRKDAITSSGSAYSHASSHDTSSKSFKHPNAAETESLGPFDLGLSSTRKITSGDSISISGIVNQAGCI
ncbi:hypothetical protein COLO4_03468 [Corchorus olitorius]|uniref:TSL-kinase interacting protein 1 n=1 Tax=Corchorus olitorius TaxID=93759 RepID=A0A1R3KYF0_9ROSI|nr:hypothetical protein COLO4_03468 [Corchorus olitorius]